MIKNSLKLTGLISLSWLMYISIALIYGTTTDFQPAAKLLMKSVQKADKPEQPDSIVSLISWNVGYGGLGAESNFFYDNDNAFFLSSGKMVRSPKDVVDKNIKGTVEFIKNSNADIYLFQEIDLYSKRSYYIDQFKLYAEAKPGFEALTAINYNVGYVPVPVLEPWNSYGQALSGLGSLSKFKPAAATRYQLPGSFDWPDKVFQLDRCAAVMRIPVANGKELLAVNIHNSAYDHDGQMKALQMNFLKDFFVSEFEKGNYIIAGGDWNQCPPGFRFDTFQPTGQPNSDHYNIQANFFPAGWSWAYDPGVPTNRNMRDAYTKGETFTSLIDFFLLSPNVEALEIKGFDLDFAYSDHQPVQLTAKLKNTSNYTLAKVSDQNKTTKAMLTRN